LFRTICVEKHEVWGLKCEVRGRHGGPSGPDTPVRAPHVRPAQIGFVLHVLLPARVTAHTTAFVHIPQLPQVWLCFAQFPPSATRAPGQIGFVLQNWHRPPDARSLIPPSSEEIPVLRVGLRAATLGRSSRDASQRWSPFHDPPFLVCIIPNLWSFVNKELIQNHPKYANHANKACGTAPGKGPCRRNHQSQIVNPKDTPGVRP
jgi:hypothetical protein